MGNRRRSRRPVALLLALGLALGGVAIAAGDATAAPKEPLRAAGPVGCTVTGKVQFRAPLLPAASPGRQLTIKAAMACIGLTGDPLITVTSGKLALSSNSFTGSCSAPNPPLMTGTIKWGTIGSRILATSVTLGAPSGTATNPYGYNFTNFTVRDSYEYARGALRITSSTPRAACGAKGLKSWKFTGSFTLSYTQLRATSIDSAEGATCAVTTAGAAKCWGSGPQRSPRWGIAGVVTGFESGIASVAVGGHSFVCAITTAGAARCFDRGQSNSSGQLGNGTFTGTTTAVQVTGLTSGVTAIDTGEDNACAIVSGGAVVCWGDNRYGQLGNGTRTNSNVPVPVTGLSSGVLKISVADEHACAILATGAAKCWGTGYAGALGQGLNHPSVPPGVDALVPIQVAGLTSGVVDISVNGLHSCAVLANGQARCWGSDGWGEAGDGPEENSNRISPVTVWGIVTAVDIGIGDGHSCVALANGTVRCWGSNTWGKVGLNFRTDSWDSAVSNPSPVPSIKSGAVQVSGGELMSCARLADGTVRCWGRNTWGALGDGSDADISWVPVTVVT